MSLTKRSIAEAIGTFWLVFGGCGSAVLAAAFPNVGIGLLGVSLAFGLTVLTMAYAVGHVSGAHFNPAVSVGMATAGRMPWSNVPGYVISQVVGGIAGALASHADAIVTEMPTQARALVRAGCRDAAGIATLVLGPPLERTAFVRRGDVAARGAGGRRRHGCQCGGRRQEGHDGR